MTHQTARGGSAPCLQPAQRAPGSQTCHPGVTVSPTLLVNHTVATILHTQTLACTARKTDCACWQLFVIFCHSPRRAPRWFQCGLQFPPSWYPPAIPAPDPSMRISQNACIRNMYCISSTTHTSCVSHTLKIEQLIEALTISFPHRLLARCGNAEMIAGGSKEGGGSAAVVGQVPSSGARKT